MSVTNQAYADAVARISELENALRGANTVLSIVYRDYSSDYFTDRGHTAPRIRAALEAVQNALYSLDYPSEVV